MPSASPLSPTFFGHIASTHDALLLFEACLNGTLNHVPRRPHDRERPSLIKSGNVFIYEEHSSGIKRWTDGVPWSPSRILGNFLVYRELERPFPPGEKKRAMKRDRRSPVLSKSQELHGGCTNTDTDSGYATGYASRPLDTTTSTSTMDLSSSSALDRDTERALIGSLVDSYGFKEDGLVKKTVSVVVGGVSHHLVSYYTVADVMSNRFTTPAKDPRFQHITPRHDLVAKQNFRTPINEVDPMDRMEGRALCNTYTHLRNGYEMTNQSISSRDMQLPIPPISYGASSLYGSYGLGANAVTYDGLPTIPAGNTYDGQFIPVSGIYSAPKTDSYGLNSYKQPRYDPMVNIGSDSGRSQVSSFNTNSLRRASIFDETNSVDSGLSVASSSSLPSKFSSDSSYASQGLYGNFRDSNQSSHNDALQKSLPNPIPPVFYDRPMSSYTAVDSSSLKDSMWQIGNASLGHGHYLGPQQQWASTGTS
ncbi:Uncharacterized protein BP5553_07100 [Venustampulla echinocandica]|uniref:Uncharacterized protein n=1 Tax=Venustampulla echinocandica TaxID=2656787 RepID=A0A370TII2_9HELO|nr:Uncharacterized protein BP5553_07100 [Venustampulla echinocandica]RDL35169.1 Uncharacterized protein BP5553_07100 [Venustampulla echinocandica]